jgi:hypothetical protein
LSFLNVLTFTTEHDGGQGPARIKCAILFSVVKLEGVLNTCFSLNQGTIEEKIYQRQTTKQSLSGAVADARKESKVEFSFEEIRVGLIDYLS